MKRTYVITLGFCNARTFTAGMKALHDTVDMVPGNIRHLVLDQVYPLDHASMVAAMHSYMDSSGCVTLLTVGRNLGLHEGFNHVFQHLGELDDDDVVVGYDPDENPLTKGWLDAMLRVFDADEKCGWLSLMSQPALEYMKQNGCRDLVVGGEPVKVPGYSLINTVCAWRGSALKAMGKFVEPHAYYGGIEGAMMPKLMGAGFWIGWMVNYGVAPLHDLADPEYKRYKRFHVGFDLPEFPGSFAEWCERKT